MNSSETTSCDSVCRTGAGAFRSLGTTGTELNHIDSVPDYAVAGLS